MIYGSYDRDYLRTPEPEDDDEVDCIDYREEPEPQDDDEIAEYQLKYGRKSYE